MYAFSPLENIPVKCLNTCILLFCGLKIYKLSDYSKYLNIIIYNVFTFINILREVGWEAEGEFLMLVLMSETFNSQEDWIT